MAAWKVPDLPSIRADTGLTISRSQFHFCGNNDSMPPQRTVPVTLIQYKLWMSLTIFPASQPWGISRICSPHTTGPLPGKENYGLCIQSSQYIAHQKENRKLTFTYRARRQPNQKVLRNLEHQLLYQSTSLSTKGWNTTGKRQAVVQAHRSKQKQNKSSF